MSVHRSFDSGTTEEGEIQCCKGITREVNARLAQLHTLALPSSSLNGQIAQREFLDASLVVEGLKGPSQVLQDGEHREP